MSLCDQKITNILVVAEAANVPEKKGSEAPVEKPTESEESKGKDEDAAAPGDTGAGAASEANGTPAKKSSKDRRRSSGVGENKSKLSRKKSQSRITHLNAKPGEYYLARLRSYAPWPSIICDEEMLPQTLLETRPVTAMQPDGSYKGEYVEGGKRVHERTFPVMFFQTNEL